MLGLVLGSLLASCDKKPDPETGPESLVRYKIDGALVEIRGSLVIGPTGSRLWSEAQQAGRANVLIELHFIAKSPTDSLTFYREGSYRLKDSFTYVIPSPGIHASVYSATHKLGGQLGGANTTGFTFILDSTQGRTSTGRPTTNGRFYGSIWDTASNRLVHITEGEFRDVW